MESLYIAGGWSILSPVLVLQATDSREMSIAVTVPCVVPAYSLPSLSATGEFSPESSFTDQSLFPPCCDTEATVPSCRDTYRSFALSVTGQAGIVFLNPVFHSIVPSRASSA